MKKSVLMIIVLITALILCASASGETTGILGKPFPDFTAEDTDGNTFSLSEALRNHDAVLLNIWATYCGPCEDEFPCLNEAWQKYGDRVAFIALSMYDPDDMDTIRAYKERHGIGFAMGRDEGAVLSGYIDAEGIPDTVIIDRFGNAAFVRVGMFSNADDIMRTLEVFVGEGYTETTVLDRVPREDTTNAFPVNESRELYPVNENAKMITFCSGGNEVVSAYLVNEGAAHLRSQITAGDNPGDMVLFVSDSQQSDIIRISAILDPEKNTLGYDLPVHDNQYSYAALINYDMMLSTGDDPEAVEVYLLKSETEAEQFAVLLKDSGYQDITWEYREQGHTAGSSPQSYIIHTIDQDGNAVPQVTLSFCTDTACTLCESDDTGTVTFSDLPGVYHVRIIEVPEGYSFDETFEIHTQKEYGEWMLRISKN